MYLVLYFIIIFVTDVSTITNTAMVVAMITWCDRWINCRSFLFYSSLDKVRVIDRQGRVSRRACCQVAFRFVILTRRRLDGLVVELLQDVGRRRFDIGQGVGMTAQKVVSIGICWSMKDRDRCIRLFQWIGSVDAKVVDQVGDGWVSEDVNFGG